MQYLFTDFPKWNDIIEFRTTEESEAQERSGLYRRGHALCNHVDSASTEAISTTATTEYSMEPPDHGVNTEYLWLAP